MFRAKKKFLPILLSFCLFLSLFFGSVPQYVSAVVSSEKDITGFSIQGQQQCNYSIDPGAHTLTFKLAPGTVLTSLAPSFQLSPNATISPDSGVAQDFTNTVTYTVTAEDDSTQAWYVTSENALPESVIFESKGLSGNTLALSWGAVANATGYSVVYASDFGFNNDKHTTTMAGNSCTIDVSGYPGITGWHVYVVVNNGNNSIGQ